MERNPTEFPFGKLNGQPCMGFVAAAIAFGCWPVMLYWWWKHRAEFVDGAVSKFQK